MKIRWHRGGLADSLATEREFNNLEELKELLNSNLKKLIYSSYTYFSIEYYAYDNRVNQDLYVIMMDGKYLYGFIYDLTYEFLQTKPTEGVYTL